MILVAVVAEMFIAAQLNMAFTVGDNTHKPYCMSRDLALYPEKSHLHSVRHFINNLVFPC